MKIVALHLGKRGAGPTYTYEMVKALIPYHNVLAIVSQYSENLLEWNNLEKDHPNLQLLTIKTHKDLKEYILNFIKSPLFLKIKNEIRKFNPDFIYIPMGSVLDKRLLSGLKFPIIQTVHDIVLHEGENGLKYKLIGIINNLFKFKTNGYIVLSHKFKNLLAQKLNISDNKIEVIPHACFKSYGAFIDIKNIDLKEYKKILFFGRIIKYKGIDILLKAFNLINDASLKLVIAGNGDLNPYLDHKKSNNVEIINRWIKDEEVANIFSDIDCVVLPYISASQSGVIPLSYSFGKPVIATNVGGMEEQVNEDKTGYIIPPNDINALKNAIEKIYEDPVKLKEMKKEAFLFSSINNWEKSAEKLINFYLQLKNDL